MGRFYSFIYIKIKHSQSQYFKTLNNQKQTKMSALVRTDYNFVQIKYLLKSQKKFMLY